MMGAIIGAVVGLAIAWAIAASQSNFTYLGNGVGSFSGMSCAANLALYLVCAAAGAVVGMMIIG